MAHNLSTDQLTGETCFFSLKEKAWHNLGQAAEEAKTSEEVLEISHLNHEIIKVPNFAKVGDSFIESGSFSTVRTDTNEVLGGMLGKSYEVLQNRDAFKFFESLVISTTDVVYQTAGALGRGETVFVTAKLPGYLRIKGSDDIIEKYLLFTNSHNASSGLILQFTDIRVVCNNTLSQALRQSSNRVYLRHTKNLAENLEKGREVMNLSLSYSNELQDTLNRLKDINITEAKETEFVKSLFLTKEDMLKLASGEISKQKLQTIDTVRESIQKAPGQELHRGTGLWLYNGVTSYFQNVKEYRSQERKFQGIHLGGEESLISGKALNHLLQLV